MSKNWYRLDTAALIFPAIARRDWCNAFRVSAGLYEAVDPAILQRAADDMRRRFPFYFVTLHKGFFWYYLEETGRGVQVHQDYAYPLTFMSSREVKRNCLRILYYKNRIAVEFFHSLTDGRGGCVYLCNLTAHYLELKYGINIPKEGMIRDLSESPLPEELEDSFLKHAAEVAAVRKEEASYRLHGTKDPVGFKTLTTGVLNTQQLLDIAHAYQVSVTAFLAAVMTESIIAIQNCEYQRKRQRPVKITIPVDLRRLYGSKTLRNFSLVLNLGVDPRFGDYSLEELCKTIYHQIAAYATKQHMAGMIAANVCVADFMHTHEFPCVYRIHEEPQKKKLQDFTKLSYLLGVPFSSKNLSPKNIQQYLSGCRDSEEYPVLSQQLLRTMAKARYDSVCAGHFGLAEPEYLHFTSPIRRYPDLIVHRMLRKYDYEHFQGNPSADQKKMQAYSESSSERERASQSAEFDCDDMKKAEYMMDHIGETAEGIITTVTNFGFFVQLPNTVEGMVRVNAMSDDFYHFDEKKMCLRGERTRTEYRVGQTVRIKVLGASKDAKTVDFGLQNMKTARKPAPVSAGTKYSTRSRAARKSEQVEEPYSSYDYGKHFRYGRDARRKQNGRKKYR